MNYRFYSWSWGYPMGRVHPFMGLAVLAFLLALYFLPTIIAALRRHRQTLAIAALNLLAGWSGLGWFGAFIWSLTYPGPDR